MSKKKFKASLMKSGDSYYYRHATIDNFQKVLLSQIPVDDDYIVGTNNFLESLNHKLVFFSQNIWVPRLLDPKFGKSEIVQFIKTGGRTSQFYDSPIGDIFLNLKDFGWSDEDVYQEFKPEIKGAGTTLSDSGLSLRDIKTLAEETREEGLVKLINKLEKESSEPLCITSKDDRDRPKGSQIKRYEYHSLKVSNMLQNNFPIKFAPELSVVKLPDEILKRIRLFNTALDPSEEMCSYDIEDYVQGIRLTPSTVRAIYFDKTHSDSGLITLTKRVSEDPETLNKTTDSMIKSSKKYLEVISDFTKKILYGDYLWAKVGDIHLSWKLDSDPDALWGEKEVNRYKNYHNFAWYLSKDMTIAGGTGYWFVDLESLRAGPRYQLSESDGIVSAEEDLIRKQELYVICVLRDMSRVTTKFEIGRHLLIEGEVPISKRREIQDHVLSGMIKEINKSDYIDITDKDNELKVEIGYKNIRELSFSKIIPKEQISPIY